MTQYTKFTPTPDGLLIELTDLGKLAAADFLTNIPNKGYINTWHELNEWEFCNGWCSVNAEQIGALTDSPIISSMLVNKTSQVNEAKIYWFPDYMIRNEVSELLTNGSVLFTLAT